MKTTILKYSMAVCATLLLVGALWAQSTPAPARGSASRWQHLALEHPGSNLVSDEAFARKINQLGDDGWELVDVETLVQEGTTLKMMFFFKRPH